MTPGFADDTRAASIAVTHVLAIGITTILLTGLLISAGQVLDNQQDRAAERELETIGNRISAEIASVDRVATPSAEERITMSTKHPSRVSGATYSVRLVDGGTGSECDTSLSGNPDACLLLTSSDIGRTVVVPVHAEDATVVSGTASGGNVRIVYENDGSNPTITIENDT